MGLEIMNTKHERGTWKKKAFIKNYEIFVGFCVHSCIQVQHVQTLSSTHLKHLTVYTYNKKQKKTTQF